MHDKGASAEAPMKKQPEINISDSEVQYEDWGEHTNETFTVSCALG